MGTFVDQVSVSSQTELSWLRYVHWLQMKSSKSRAALQKKLQFGKLPFNFSHIISQVYSVRVSYECCSMSLPDIMLKVVFIYLFNMNIVHEYAQEKKKKKRKE